MSCIVQLSLDLSERLERILLMHHEQYEQQEKHQQQPEFVKSGLHFQRRSYLATAIKPATTAGASPLASATPSSLVSDSLQEFVSKVDARSHAAATRFTSSNPDIFFLRMQSEIKKMSVNRVLFMMK
jgi:hypothetical protein